jgi:hypothetical protein
MPFCVTLSPLRRKKDLGLIIVGHKIFLALMDKILLAVVSWILDFFLFPHY